MNKNIFAVLAVAIALTAATLVSLRAQDEIKPKPDGRVDKLLKQNEDLAKNQDKILKNQEDMLKLLEDIKTGINGLRRRSS